MKEPRNSAREKAKELASTWSTAEEFADWCFPTADTVEDRREFFRAINWREGYTYCCQSRGYAIATGYNVVLKALESL